MNLTRGQRKKIKRLRRIEMRHSNSVYFNGWGWFSPFIIPKRR